MTAHPQTQPMPGTVPAAAPVRPVAEKTSPKPKGASRNARIVLGLSLLVATAGVSFAVGHMTAEEAAGTTASPFAAGAMPMASAADGAEADTTTDTTTTEVSALDPSGSGTGRPGMAAAAAVDTDTEVEAITVVTAAEVGDAAMAPPDGAMGGRPEMGGMPGGTEGTVAEIGDSSLTITAADGSEQTFVIDATTSWVQQAAIDVSAVQPGDEVSVQVPFAGPGTDTADASATTVATEVTVTVSAA